MAARSGRLGRARRSGRISRRQIKDFSSKVSRSCYVFVQGKTTTFSSNFENSSQIRSKHLSKLVACSSRLIPSRADTVSVTLLPNWSFDPRFSRCYVFVQGKSDTSGKNFENSFQDGFIPYVNLVACPWERQRRWAGRGLDRSLSPKFHVWHFLTETRQFGVDCAFGASWACTGDDSGPNGHNLVPDYWKIHQEHFLYCLDTKNIQFHPNRFWALPSLQIRFGSLNSVICVSW